MMENENEVRIGMSERKLGSCGREAGSKRIKGTDVIHNQLMFSSKVIFVVAAEIDRQGLLQ